MILSRAYRSLVLAELRKSLRKTPREGATKIPPILWTFGLGLFFGSITSIGLLVMIDDPIAESGVLGLAWPAWIPLCAIFMYCGLMLTQETENFFPDPVERDVIVALPVPRGMTTTAKVGAMIMLSLVVGFSIGLPSYIAGFFTHPSPLIFVWLFPCLVVLTSVMSACFFVALSALIVAPLPRKWSRAGLGLVQMAFGTAIFILPQVTLRSDYAKSVAAVVGDLPLAWVAAPFGVVEQGVDSPFMLQTVIVLGSVAGLLLVIPYLVRFAYAGKIESEQTSSSVATLREQSSLLSRRAQDPLVQAGYDMTAWLLWRDRKLRMATISQVISPLILVLVLGRDDGFPSAQYAPLLGMLFGPALLTQSLRTEVADASWIYKVMPIDDARRIWFGVHRYHQNRVLPVLSLVTGLFAMALYGVKSGLMLGVLSYGFSLVAMNLSHFTVTAPPYSRRFRAGTSNMKVGTLFLVMTALGVLLIPLWLIENMQIEAWIKELSAFGMLGFAFFVSEMLKRYALRPMPIKPNDF